MLYFRDLFFGYFAFLFILLYFVGLFYIMSDFVGLYCILMDRVVFWWISCGMLESVGFPPDYVVFSWIWAGFGSLRWIMTDFKKSPEDERQIGKFPHLKYVTKLAARYASHFNM